MAVRCQYCGAEIPEDSLFCVRCGNAVSRGKSDGGQNSSESRGRCCPQCGRTVSEKARFCAGCGAALGEPPKDAPRTGRSNTALYWVAGVAVVLMLASAGLYFFLRTGKTDSADTEAAAESETVSVPAEDTEENFAAASASADAEEQAQTPAAEPEPSEQTAPQQTQEEPPQQTLAERIASEIDQPLPAADASAVYPSAPLTDAALSGLDVRQIQHYVNTIYAKNGYAFKTEEAADFFALLPWYRPVSGDQDVIRSRMSKTDQDNLDLVISYRNLLNFDPSITGADSLWTFAYTDRLLTDDELAAFSQYDIYLLADTILAKNGYIFSTAELNSLFAGQRFYTPVSADAAGLALSDTDEKNLERLERLF